MDNFGNQLVVLLVPVDGSTVIKTILYVQNTPHVTTPSHDRNKKGLQNTAKKVRQKTSNKKLGEIQSEVPQVVLKSELPHKHKKQHRPTTPCRPESSMLMSHRTPKQRHENGKRAVDLAKRSWQLRLTVATQAGPVVAGCS